MQAQMAGILNNILKNKHTTAAGAIYALEQFGFPILEIWFPQFKPKLDATKPFVQGFAVVYGLAAAGDSTQSAKAHEETKAAVSNLQNQLDQVKSDTATFKKP